MGCTYQNFEAENFYFAHKRTFVQLSASKPRKNPDCLLFLQPITEQLLSWDFSTVFWLVERSEKDRNLFCAGRLEYYCTKVRFVHKVNELNLLYGMYLAKPFCGTTIVAAILSRACSIFDEWFRNQLPLKRSKW